jgi:hypothetical protein
MTSRDFCYWLQGFFELRDTGSLVMTPQQVEMVQRHLALVFKHEIDPSQGPPEHQAELNAIHSSPAPAKIKPSNATGATHSIPPFRPHGGETLVRC